MEGWGLPFTLLTPVYIDTFVDIVPWEKLHLWLIWGFCSALSSAPLIFHPPVTEQCANTLCSHGSHTTFISKFQFFTLKLCSQSYLVGRNIFPKIRFAMIWIEEHKRNSVLMSIRTVWTLFCTIWVRLSILMTTGIFLWTCLCVSHICSRIASLSAALIVFSDPSCVEDQCDKQCLTSAYWNILICCSSSGQCTCSQRLQCQKQLTQKLQQIQQMCLKDSWAWSQRKGQIDMESESNFVETEIWQRLFTQGTSFNFPL